MPSPDLTSIPTDEQEKFARHLFSYQFDSVIIQEGQDDRDVYLLREGTLSIEKTIGNKSTRISTIDAVNFFGEMALIVKAKRTATVRVISRHAIVYRFHFLDLKAIYSNPAWSELLIARLCNDLVETNNRAVSMEKESLQLGEKNKIMVDQVSQLFSALLSLQKDTAASLVLNSKAWILLKGMRELTGNYLQARLPEVFVKVNQDNRQALYKLSAEEDFPETLKPMI